MKKLLLSLLLLLPMMAVAQNANIKLLEQEANYIGVPLTRMDINLLYDMLKDCILKDPTLWEPGSIQGEPTSLLTKVRVKYSYSRK